MSNADLPKNTVGTESIDHEDIPVALREVSPSSSRFPWLLLVSLGIAALGAVAVGFTLFVSNPGVGVAESQPEGKTEKGETDSEEDTPEDVENLLGHLPYEEAEEENLVAITADGQIRLQEAAAQEFKAMLEAARRDGINLALLSGYRTKAQQQNLFFEVKQQRNQNATKRAEVSAPPGYSEHHTGYAIDIGDANVPTTHLTEDFDKTAAFRWLEENAARFSFELSFPQDNPQGIQYEPWHWRFVGDLDSLETFYRAQNLKEAQTNREDD